ncbi:hypothetical protein, partial [Bordetella pertussis]|uniref:hypothetical protein n=1 Tax=Bordetella pertussis TaxID=520 RepID=UPI0021CB9006
MIEWLHGFDQHAPGLDTVLASDVAQALHGLAQLLVAGTSTPAGTPAAPSSRSSALPSHSASASIRPA